MSLPHSVRLSGTSPHQPGTWPPPTQRGNPYRMRVDRQAGHNLPTPPVSVLTLVRNRQSHLDALVAGLTRQTCINFELVIASMQPEPPRICPSVPFPVSVVTVRGERLPLAAARNAAAHQARANQLVFLDVDCIPSPSLVASF